MIERCEKCKRPMRKQFALELHRSLVLYFPLGVMNIRKSQGIFLFHKSCAMKALEKTVRRQIYA